MQIVKLKDYSSKCFDIIENDEEKDYGYTEVCDTEDDSGNIVYGCSAYTHRLPLSETADYEEAVQMLRENGDNGIIKSVNIADIINAHLDWWFQPFMTLEEINKLDVHIGTYQEITELLRKGFTEPRLLYANPDWQ